MATPPELEDNGVLFIARLVPALADEETAVPSFAKADFTALITAAKNTGSGLLGTKFNESGLELAGTVTLTVKLTSNVTGRLVVELVSEGLLTCTVPTEADEDLTVVV